MTMKKPHTVLPYQCVPNDIEWIKEAVKNVEECIENFVQEFLEHPYLHRVEHSLHVRLYSMLKGRPWLKRNYQLAEREMSTQLIHKEWPERSPRHENGNRRGNFDLAVLAPSQIKGCALDDFTSGRL